MSYLGALRWLGLLSSLGQFGQSAVLRGSSSGTPAPLERSLPAGDTIHVVYSTTRHDNSYMGLLSSMLSVARNLREPSRVTLHLIVPTADLDYAQLLIGCFRAELEATGGAAGAVATPPVVQLHPVRPPPFEMTSGGSFKGGQPRVHEKGGAPFARMYLHEYLPNVSRAIWLDTDTVVQGDLATLWKRELRTVMAAKIDKGRNFWQAWLRELNLPKDSPTLQRYPDWHTQIFNDGVLLVDLERWRRENISQGIERWARTVRADGFAVDDQFLLNLQFQKKGSFDTLGDEWNAWNRATGEGLRGSPQGYPCVDEPHQKILHWSGPMKPWHRDAPLMILRECPAFERYYPRLRCWALPSRCSSLRVEDVQLLVQNGTCK